MSCEKKTEVYSRVVGYFRPTHSWNDGKSEEFKDRKTYKEPDLSKITMEEIASECNCRE